VEVCLCVEPSAPRPPPLPPGYSGRPHHLPSTLAALPALRSLQLARIPGPGEPSGVFNGSDAL
jgi:hypothetical protein